MKPQARIQATIEIFEKIEENTRVPMDTVVGDYMRNRRYIGSKDRSNVAERIYEVMRRYARLNWWLECSGAEKTARNTVIVYLALCEGADLKRFKDMFDGSKYAPEMLSDEDMAFIKKLEGNNIEHADMPLDVSAECPPLYADKLKSYFGDDFKTEMLAMLDSATLDLRVNMFSSDIDKAKAALEKDGIKTTPTQYSKVGLRCENKAYLSRTKAMQKGWIEIQDEGSQLIAQMCDAKPGMQVLDYCAGGGGKTRYRRDYREISNALPPARVFRWCQNAVSAAVVSTALALWSPENSGKPKNSAIRRAGQTLRAMPVSGFAAALADTLAVPAHARRGNKAS